MNQLTELRPPDFTDVTKWWIFSNKSLLVCLGGGVIAYLLFKITAMLHLAFLGVWFGVMLEAGLFIGVTFPVPDFGSSLLAFGGRTADELIISLIAHRLNITKTRNGRKNSRWKVSIILPGLRLRF